MPKVSVILPTYNERGNIAPLSTELIVEIRKAGHVPEIVIVDDNSPDETAKEAIKIAKKHKEIKVIVREKEKGLATAILTGIQNSEGEVIVVMDCDFSHPPKFVPKMLEQMKDADAVFASRYVKGGTMNTDKLQYHLSRLFNYAIKLLTGIQVLDSTNGFFAIRRSALDCLLNREVFSGYGDYCFKMLYALKPKKLKVKEIPFSYMPRCYGSSKTSIPKVALLYFLEAIKLKMKGGKLHD